MNLDLQDGDPITWAIKAKSTNILNHMSRVTNGRPSLRGNAAAAGPIFNGFIFGALIFELLCFPGYYGLF